MKISLAIGFILKMFVFLASPLALAQTEKVFYSLSANIAFQEHTRSDTHMVFKFEKNESDPRGLKLLESNVHRNFIESLTYDEVTRNYVLKFRYIFNGEGQSIRPIVFNTVGAVGYNLVKFKSEDFAAVRVLYRYQEPVSVSQSLQDTNLTNLFARSVPVYHLRSGANRDEFEPLVKMNFLFEGTEDKPEKLKLLGSNIPEAHIVSLNFNPRQKVHEMIFRDLVNARDQELLRIPFNWRATRVFSQLYWFEDVDINQPDIVRFARQMLITRPSAEVSKTHRFARRLNIAVFNEIFHKEFPNIILVFEGSENDLKSAKIVGSNLPRIYFDSTVYDPNDRSYSIQLRNLTEPSKSEIKRLTFYSNTTVGMDPHSRILPLETVDISTIPKSYEFYEPLESASRSTERKSAPVPAPADSAPAPAAAAAPPSEQAQFWQWQAEINRASPHRPILVNVTLYDPLRDPVLVDFAMKQEFRVNYKTETRFNMTTERVQQFDVVEEPFQDNGSAEKAFRVSFKKPNVRATSNLSPEPVMPPSEVFLFTDGRMKLVGKNYILRIPAIGRLGSPGSSKVVKHDRENFTFSYLAPAAPIVFEPGTINGVNPRAYFRPKGVIEPFVPNSSRWQISFWEQDETPPESKSRSISSIVNSIQPTRSAEDLMLGGSLAERKAEVWTLLEQVERPTIEQMIRLIGQPGSGEQNPFAAYGSNLNLAEGLKDSLPLMIARFEYYFKDATWYGLGRDIYLLSDALDAFYTYLGQPGRVKRLHASASSFDSRSIEDVIQFLKDNGFDFESIAPESRPQILFDVTSFQRADTNRFSQSAQLMRAAYRVWTRLGREPADLVRKVNFISTASPSRNTIDVYRGLTVDQLFQSIDFDKDGPTRIPYIPAAWSLHYTEAWHAPYGRFRVDLNGKMNGIPGTPNYLSSKLQILSELWSIANIVMNKEFVERVNGMGKPYGVAFEVKDGSCAGQLGGVEKPQ